MTEKEKMYYKKFGKEYLTLKESCQIWVKPGYSTLSKLVPNIGYETAVKKNVIPQYKQVGKTYLFKIKDILTFLGETK
jgi:hypothetical protein